jgi:hypothetical protein
MKTAIKLSVIYGAICASVALAMTSCASQKRYVSCDAYKTHYKPVKAERHHGHHIKCDAYN